MADYGEGLRNYDRFTVRPGSGRLDDDQWHDVKIIRRGRKVWLHQQRFNFIERMNSLSWVKCEKKLEAKKIKILFCDIML